MQSFLFTVWIRLFFLLYQMISCRQPLFCSVIAAEQWRLLGSELGRHSCPDIDSDLVVVKNCIEVGDRETADRFVRSRWQH